MTDLHDLRSRLRDDVRRGSSPEDDGSGRSYMLVFATCGVVIGFALFMFVPRFFQTSATATIRDVSIARPASDVRPNEAGHYAGRAPEDIGPIADEVCAMRLHQGPGKAPRIGSDNTEFLNAEGLKRINEQMNCLLTEGPMRFCATAQRKMLVNEIVLYFRGIEQATRLAGALRGADARNGASTEVLPDSRVITAIEARLRDGQLTIANRDLISSEAPRWVRDRFVKIDGKHPLCPEKPWWAVWR